jgi:single-strand DNA-binding protein
MPALNRIELIGRLGKDPETHLTATGKKVCTFSIAVDRRRKNVEGEKKPATDWFNVEAWGHLGEIIQQYLHKGRLIYLDGRVQTDRYEHEGESRTATKVIARSIQMLERRPEEGEEPALPEGDDEPAE